MSELSEADIIAKNPIGDSLDGFGDALEFSCKKYGLSEVKGLMEIPTAGK